MDLSWREEMARCTLPLLSEILEFDLEMDPFTDQLNEDQISELGDIWYYTARIIDHVGIDRFPVVWATVKKNPAPMDPRHELKAAAIGIAEPFKKLGWHKNNAILPTQSDDDAEQLLIYMLNHNIFRLLLALNQLAPPEKVWDANYFKLKGRHADGFSAEYHNPHSAIDATTSAVAAYADKMKSIPKGQ